LKPKADIRKKTERIILEILAKKGTLREALSVENDLQSDLGMDSLDLAELSVMLEREFGKDPYSKGIFPRNLGQLLDYYEKAGG
jgi:acyl carrier protein